MQFYLETDRLILRAMQLEDTDAMFVLDSDPLVHKYLGNKPIHSKSQAETYVNFIIQQYKERGIGRFAVVLKSTNIFVGWSGLKLNLGDKEAFGNKRDFYDIGYRLLPKYWGKGYATESAIACLEYGFTTLNLETICGAADAENIASNIILKNIGLHYKEQFPYKNVRLNWYELNTSEYAKTMS